MANGMFLEFGHQAPCSGKFAWLGNHPSLAIRKGSTVEAVLAICHYCSSKPCLQFGPFWPRSLQQMQLPKNYYNFGTGSYQIPSSKLVLNGGCVVQKVQLRSCR